VLPVATTTAATVLLSGRLTRSAATAIPGQRRRPYRRKATTAIPVGGQRGVMLSATSAIRRLARAAT
jgi:hypothetical protein